MPSSLYSYTYFLLWWFYYFFIVQNLVSMPVRLIDSIIICLISMLCMLPWAWICAIYLYLNCVSFIISTYCLLRSSMWCIVSIYSNKNSSSYSYSCLLYDDIAVWYHVQRIVLQRILSRTYCTMIFQYYLEVSNIVIDYLRVSEANEVPISSHI